MNRIAELRKAQNMSQKQFSRLLNVAQNTISQWETEQRDIDSSTLLKISEYFGVTTDYLLGRTDDPTPPQKEKAPSRHEGVLQDLEDLSPDMELEVREFINYLKHKNNLAAAAGGNN